jgi:hypothetical protein
MCNNGRVRHAICGFLLAPALGILLHAQPAADLDLPPGAVVIERAAIPQGVHPHRELVLWMLSPKRNDRGELSQSNPYSCPEMTLGSYYSGPTRISLVDSSAKRVINTIGLRSSYEEDSFDVPYRILADFYYLVPGGKRGQEGKPKLLALHDFNGDGLPLETAFFEAEACMGLMTTLIGYSPKQDRVIQYQVELKITAQKAIKGRGLVNEGEATTETRSWADYLFAQKPSGLGHWSFKIDYTGRGGPLDQYRVHYDPSREMFFGDLTRIAPPWEPPTTDQNQPKPEPAR